jgi:hypothetical protein
VIPTLFSSHRPVERYEYLLSGRLAAPSAPEVTVGAIDAFIVQELTACSPASSVAVDLAADATLGASVVLWVVQPSVQRVLVTRDPARSGGDSAWRLHLVSLLDELEIHPSPAARIWLDVDLHSSDAWRVASDALAPPMLWVSVAVVDADPKRIESCLEQLLALHDNVVLLLFPLGALGSSVAIEAALRLSQPHSGFRFMAIRELSPFVASSQLGIICRRDNTTVAEGLRRIQRLYEGNFHFLHLAETVVRGAEEYAALQQELDKAHATLTAMEIKFVSPLVIELRRHAQQARTQGLRYIPRLMQRLARRVI